MKILVTGASGFIGSALVPELRKVGHDVWEGMRYVSGGRYGFYEQEGRVFFDLRDGASVRKAVLKVKPDTIIHLGAVSAVSYSFGHSEEIADVIYMGTVRIADAAREVGAWLIFASSSEVYGRNDHKYPITEDQPLGGTSPYAAAKVAAEEYLRVLMQVYKTPVTIMRPFNTIGRAPVNNRHFVVERAITQAIEQGEIRLHDPRPLRDLMFRTDHVEAYMQVLHNSDLAVGETFNVSTGDCWSIGEMAEYVAKKIGARTEKVISVSFAATPDRPLDILKLQGNSEKAKVLLSWYPRFTIASGLERACEEWWKAIGLKT